MATDTAGDGVSIMAGQQGFDPLGPTVRTASIRDGRTMHYIDEGERSWPTLLFFGGAGTTVRSFALMEFARTLREQLGIRVISVERNGLGQTVFEPDDGVRDYADDVWGLLDGLGVAEVSLVAVSGGGPYAAWMAKAQSKRVRSLHLACAWAQGDGTELADVHYRHGDHILTDVAHLGERTILCHEGRDLRVPAANVEELLAEGATRGPCAWA